MAKAKSGSITIKSDPSWEELDKAWSFSQRSNLGVAVLQSANLVMSNLRKTTPRRTNKLLMSQRLSKVNDLERAIIEIVAYGRFIRAGVPPSKINPILPRRKKALFWPGARHPVRAVYNHPGIKKNDYWQKAINMSEGKFDDYAARVAGDIEASINI